MKVLPPDSSKQDVLMPPGPARQAPKVPKIAQQPAARNRKPKLLDRLREALRSHHYSRRTEQIHCHWVKRFIFFHNVGAAKR
jgi:hypothetical protein